MLTKRQKQILDFIEDFTKEKGYPPSLEEIKHYFKLNSVSTVHEHLQILQKKGYLEKRENQSRAIEVRKKEQLIQIPLLGKIAAGQPIEAITDKEIITVPKSRLPHNGNFYALRVKGNSMIDENINDKDIVIIKNQPTADFGQRIVALIDNFEVTLKKIFKEGNKLRLQPANPKIPPILIDPKRVTIQGVVVDVIHNASHESYKEPTTENQQNKRNIYNKLPLNQIICGDAVNVMKQMPDSSIDLTVTSPPYDNLRKYGGNPFPFDDFKLIAEELYRVTKKGGVVVWVVGDQTIKGDETGTSFRQALYFKEVGFTLFDTMIYLKAPRGAVGNNKTYWQTFEYMFILSKGTPKTINIIKDRKNKEARAGDNGTKRQHDGSLLKVSRNGYSKYGRRTNVWDYLIGRGHSSSDKIAYEHPAIFPEKLAEDHIISWSKEGEIVYDPFMGSGTTAKMAFLNNRKYIGSELHKKYCEIAEKRLAPILAQKKLL